MQSTSDMRERLDKALMRRGLFDSRARAVTAILGGRVSVDGRLVTQPAHRITGASAIEISPCDSARYVSRGALKLMAALDHFECDPSGQIALDLGASTGGFTEILIERGARQVFAVDVGHGQLHDRLRGHQRVINLERTHAKDLTPAIITDAPGIITCDLSFISLKKALPSALALARPGATLIALIKPQFELGPAAIGKGGIVNAGPDALQALCQDIGHWLATRGWSPRGIIDSPIKGGDGNKEFLIAAQKH